MKLLALFVGSALAFGEYSQSSQEFSDGYTQFAANVYKEMQKSNFGNFLVCPLSVELILALVQDGARGTTAQQLAHALHLPVDRGHVKQIFQELTQYLRGNDYYNLTSANKVYVKNGFEISDQFKSTALNVFDADVQNINFKDQDEAASEINAWVEDKTHGKIEDLIGSDDLYDSTRMVLINIMYFDGKWVQPFNQRLTKRRPFHINSVDRVHVEMMQTRNFFNYHEDCALKAKFLELPYEGGDITMTIVLPNDVEGLDDLEDRIADVLIAPKYKLKKVDVRIPKFKIESTIKFKPILKALGIVDAFEDTADFSGIGGQQEPLKISKVIQKTFIEVDEKGTTAAAASMVTADARSNQVRPNGSKKFIADHPFIYYVKSKSAGLIFVGRFLQK